MNVPARPSQDNLCRCIVGVTADRQLDRKRSLRPEFAARICHCRSDRPDDRRNLSTRNGV